MGLNKTFFLLFLTFCVVHEGFAADAENNRLPVLRYDIDASGGWLPYDQTGIHDKPGIFTELIPLLMTEAQIPIQGIPLPIKRALFGLKKGELDFDFVSLAWFPAKHPGEAFVVSDGLFSVAEYFVALASHDVMSLADIYRRPVGTINGYYYHDDAQLKRQNFRSEQALMQGLAKKRFDVAILEKLTAQYWSKVEAVPIQFMHLHSQGELVLRLRNEHSYLLDRINGAIARLKARGQLQALIDKYSAPVK